MFIRHFLLAGLVISIVFPILPVKITLKKPSFLTINTTEAVSVIAEPNTNELKSNNISIKPEQIQSQTNSSVKKSFPWYLLIYCTGVVFFSIRFFRNLLLLNRKIRISEKVQQYGYTQVLVKQGHKIFSFFQYIFIPKDQYNTIDNSILEHEKAHVFQRHSADIILVELAQILFWFNPVIYLYKQAILINHEYLADQSVLRANIDKIEYQKTLLNYFGRSNSLQFTSGFNFKHTKYRITMIMKTNSKTGRIVKPAISFILSFIIFATIALQFEESNAMQNDFNALPQPEGSVIKSQYEPIESKAPTQDKKKKKTTSKDTDLKTLVEQRDSLHKVYEEKIELAHAEAELELKNLSKRLELQLKQQTLIAEKELKEKQLELESKLLKKQQELRKKKNITPKEEQAFMLYQNQLEIEFQSIEQQLGLEIEFLEDSMENVVAIAEQEALHKIQKLEFEYQQELQNHNWEMKKKVTEMNEQ